MNRHINRKYKCSYKSTFYFSSIEEHFGIGFIRPIDHATSSSHPKNIGARSSIPISPSRVVDPVESELHNILDEIRVITNKIRDEVRLTLTFCSLSNLLKVKWRVQEYNLTHYLVSWYIKNPLVNCILAMLPITSGNVAYWEAFEELKKYI